MLKKYKNKNVDVFITCFYFEWGVVVISAKIFFQKERQE